MFEFKIKNKSKKSRGRIGSFITPHGAIETPVFMPVGTVGAVKTMSPRDLREVGAQIILGNTYHLYLRPGNDLIKKAGGLHGFTSYDGPILTDSGGFQVFSLGESRIAEKGGKLKGAKIADAGVKFYSHLDGSEHFFSPEKSIKIQEDLGADIIMAFDECPPASASRNQVEKAVERTHKWLRQCLEAKTRDDQALFPICQGGSYKDLREASAKFIDNLGLHGNAIGGVSVGEEKDRIYQVTDWCTSVLAENKPRYLMGIGYPEDIVKVVLMGVDMFDCVLPTRLARHGVFWRMAKDGGEKSVCLAEIGESYEQLDVKNSRFKEDFSTISEDCRCKACAGGFSLSYIRHLVLQNEPLGIHLLTCHNLKFLSDLVEALKEGIQGGRF